MNMQNFESLNIVAIFENKGEKFGFTNHHTKISFLDINCLSFLQIENFSKNTLNQNELLIKLINNGLSVDKIANSFVDIYLCKINEKEVSSYQKTYKGFVSTVKIKNEYIELNVQNLITRLKNSRVGVFFSKTCRAAFGDNKCNMDLSSHSALYDIKCIIDKNNINVQFINGVSSEIDIKYFALSNLFVIKKSNIDLSRLKEAFYLNQIIYSDKIYDDTYQIVSIDVENNKISLSRNFNFLNIEEYFVCLIRFCDKSIDTCSGNFNNAENFRGEPFINEK